MTCKHLRELCEMCEKHHVKLSSMDLVRLVCLQCGVEEACPSVMMSEYDERHPGDAPASRPEPPPTGG
jgi:hypothetical protein